ncbi:MAG: pitrilysin family protein [Kofleriaceae bacterium]
MRTLVLVIVLAACGSPPPPAHPLPNDNYPVASPPQPPPAVPADPAPKTEGTITEAWAHGIHILVKRNPGSETTVTNLYLRGGVRNWSAADAGVESMALATAVHGGTATWAKDEFTQHLSNLGSTLEATSGEDQASLDSWSLTPVWDQTFEMLVSAFLQPVMPTQQIELERRRMLAALANEQADPDSLLSLRAHAIVFKGNPYANRASGTKESVSSLTPDQLRAHLAKLRDRSRLLLVVVGDIDPARVIAATNRAFEALPAGTYQETKLPELAPSNGLVTAFEQKLPTNYIFTSAPAPQWGTPDFFPAWLAVSVLRTRLFNEVRTKRNLSYAPSARMSRTLFPRVSMYVTAVDPIATMAVMLGEAKKLRDEPIPADELEGEKSTFVTYTVMAAEDAAGQADNLALAQNVGGDWRLLQDLPAKIHAVTAAQITAWAKAHLTHFQTVVIGDPTKLDRKALESF